MPQICAEYNVDDIQMGFFVVVPKVFSAFPTGTLVRRLGVHGRLGGDVTGTGDSN